MIAPTQRDIENLAASYLTPEIVAAAQIQRADSVEGAEIVGRQARNGHSYAGLIIPYFWPGESRPREYRLRRDEPDLERQPDGSVKEKAKYLSPPGRGNLFFFPPNTRADWLTDTNVPATFTEGEKKGLALSRFHNERGETRLVIALPGAWNWRGVVNKETSANGQRRDVTGAIPDFDRIKWHGRQVAIIFDANAVTNQSVVAARRGLSAELKRRGASVRLFDLPAEEGVNGVDDLLALKGPRFVAELFQEFQEFQDEGEEWESPVPFDEYDLPEFPTDALPAWLHSFVVGLARETQTPVDVAAVLSLAACAGAVAGNVEIEARRGWREPLNLFVVAALPPGNRKSAVFASVVKPLERAEASLVAENRADIAEAESEYRMLVARVDHLEKAAAKAKDPEDRQAKQREAVEAAHDLAEMSIPKVPRLLADDTTPETLATLLHDQRGRIAVFSPEGDIFDIMGGRYSNGVPNLGVFLKGHAGDQLRVDRRGRSEFINRPSLTIGLTVQPDVLRGLVSKSAFKGRGLLGRFLYSLPHSTLGSRKVRANPLDEEARAEYERNVRAMAGISADFDGDGDRTARLVRLTPEADDYLAAFEEEIEPHIAEAGELGSLSDWAGKLAGAALRITGLLHLADHAGRFQNWPEKVPSATIKRAIEVARYLIPHAQAAYAEMGADPEIEAAKHLLKWARKWVESTGDPLFTKQNAWQGTKGKFKKVADLDKALALLTERGFIRPRVEDRKKGPGRKPGGIYEINPQVSAYNSYNSYNSATAVNSRDSRNFRHADINEREVITI
jgi:hypothetical protein